MEVLGHFVFTEVEMRALDALAGYGTDDFLKIFYAEMGEHYLKPHEKGIRTLFTAIREQMPGILKRADNSRKVFSGECVAINKPDQSNT